MSKLFDTEPRPADPSVAEAAYKLRQKAQQQDAVDAESALHIELLAQTDAKLDRVNARLERLGSELSRWAQDLYEVRQAPEQVSSRHHRRGAPFLATGLLLCLGAVAGALAVAWQHGDLAGWPAEAYNADAMPSSASSWFAELDPAPMLAPTTAPPLSTPKPQAPVSPHAAPLLFKPQPVAAHPAPDVAQASPPIAHVSRAPVATPSVSSAAPLLAASPSSPPIATEPKAVTPTPTPKTPVAAAPSPGVPPEEPAVSPDPEPPSADGRIHL